MSIMEGTLKKTIGRIRSIRYENPVVTREVRTRMRGAKAHQLMLLYVFLMAVFVFGAYYMEWMNNSGTYSAQSWANMRLGHNLFSVLTWCQAILIVLIAQGLTVGSLTLEKEQQTIEMLSLTSLSARNIIAGKVAAPMLFILMLLACSLPIAGICLMFGSISPMEIIVSYLILVSWAFLFASMGVFFSSISKKTSAAVIGSFLVSGIYACLITGLSAISFSGLGGSSWKMVFSGMSGCWATDCSLSMAGIFGFKLPIALVGIAFNVAIAVLMLTFSTTRLPFHRETKHVLIRSLLLGITLVALFLFLGNMFAPAGPMQSSPQGVNAGVLFIILVVISPFIPVFATGPLDRTRNAVKAVFVGPTWKKIFENRPTGGLWFLVVWWISLCLVIVLSFVLGHHAAGGPVYVPDWSLFVQSCLALLAVVVGIASMGIMFSSLATTRQAAAALTVVFIILAWAIFPIMRGTFEQSYNHVWSQAVRPQWQAAYLWPGLSLDALSRDLAPGTSDPRLAFPVRYTGYVCTVAWLLLSFVALWITCGKQKQGGGVRDEQET